MKYKLGKKHPTEKLYQVVYTDDTVGGWVESEKNLSQDGNAQVYGDARVYGDAQVYGNAQVAGNARVYGDAQVNYKVHSIILSNWTITLLHDLINIGCESHSYKYWFDNYRKIGKENGMKAAEIKQYGEVIKIASKLRPKMVK